MTKPHILDRKSKAPELFYSDAMRMSTQNIHCMFKEPETDYKNDPLIAREHLLKTT